MHQILLVEDDSLLREGLNQVLQEEGCAVVAASDGGEALDRLRSGEVSPCLILLDLMMPGMNGWEFLRLHGRDPSLSRIPIVVGSALPFAENEDQPAIVLQKPFSPGRLMRTIEEHCACGDGHLARPQPSARP